MEDMKRAEDDASQVHVFPQTAPLVSNGGRTGRISRDTLVLELITRDFFQPAVG